MRIPSLLSPSKRSEGTSAARSAPSQNSAATQWKRHGTALPGWRELEDDANRSAASDVPRSSNNSFLERVSTLRFTLLILLVAALFTLYVGHVHATQRVLAKLQDARATQHVLRLKHNRLKGAFDQKTGPSVIYERARALGLEENVTYGPTIPLER
jgi:hypothetical protein